MVVLAIHSREGEALREGGRGLRGGLEEELDIDTSFSQFPSVLRRRSRSCHVTSPSLLSCPRSCPVVRGVTLASSILWQFPAETSAVLAPRPPFVTPLAAIERAEDGQADTIGETDCGRGEV